MINIMELIKKEDENKDEIPCFNRDLWKRGLYKMIEKRAEHYPTLSICEECTESCRQVQVVGLFRFYCGVKGIDWRL